MPSPEPRHVPGRPVAVPSYASLDRPNGHNQRAATDEEARALASTVRLRILRVCLHEERTNKEIAEVLGNDPASTLHHVRRLVDTGFLEPGEPRRGKRGSREIPYRATGKSWTVQSPGAGATMLATFLDEIALVPAEALDLTRVGLRLRAEDHAEFYDRLIALLVEFTDRGDALPDGDAWSVFVALHPDPNRPAPGA